MHFASTEAMDIRGLGEKLADQLVDRRLVKDLADLYELTVEDLKPFSRMGDTSARNFIGSIERSQKNARLDRLIYGLGIPHVGRALASDLAANLRSVDRLAAADARALRAAGFGAVVSSAIEEWSGNPDNRELIRRLQRAGIDPRLERKGRRLEGRTLVFTGELDRLTREQAKEAVVEQGGRVAESVSGKTDWLIVGARAGATKLEDARKYGTRTLGEPEFLRLIT
jgi:DNA ligase (NAD+)